MKRIMLIVASLFVSLNVLAHPEHGDDSEIVTEADCSDIDLAGTWTLFHPDGKGVSDKLEPDTRLVIEYDPDYSTDYGAFLLGSIWQVDGTQIPELTMKCDPGPPNPNAVLRIPIVLKSDSDETANLCVERVRQRRYLAERGGSAPTTENQVAIYKTKGDDCQSYHGRYARNEVEPATMAPTNPGHSHADY